MSESENQYVKIRKKKGADLRSEGINPFKNGISPTHKIGGILGKYGSVEGAALEADQSEFVIAGRMMALRSFGKAAFLKLRDNSGDLQVFVEKQTVGEEQFKLFKKLDVGDIVLFKGNLFRTKTDELTLASNSLTLLTKSYRPLPEKWHGLTDVETRYRQRYVDLIVNEGVMETFIKRSRIIQALRDFMTERDFLEVETPMMHPIPGGAAAKPFVTHHNKLDMDLYLRVAPELYLKRLLVGGMERVFEINRNFRNEGISIKHNPEFTMLEFYQSYATYEDLIKLTEEMLSSISQKVLGKTKILYQGQEIDFTPPYKRYTIEESLIEVGKVPPEVLKSREKALNFAQGLGDKLKSKDEGLGAITTEIFELVVEQKLINPTFITQYPIEVSPLSRRK
ncbi:MAG TPA: lysine--tRNA ligase, partial [bacterium]|nr:lysine--tRNA ligase [bacterium]